jgi:hypothetical protein
MSAVNSPESCGVWKKVDFELSLQAGPGVPGGYNVHDMILILLVSDVI